MKTILVLLFALQGFIVNAPLALESNKTTDNFPVEASIGGQRGTSEIGLKELKKPY